MKSAGTLSASRIILPTSPHHASQLAIIQGVRSQHYAEGEESMLAQTTAILRPPQ